jgi:hypothetical protein
MSIRRGIGQLAAHPMKPSIEIDLSEKILRRRGEICSMPTRLTPINKKEEDSWRFGICPMLPSRPIYSSLPCLPNLSPTSTTLPLRKCTLLHTRRSMPIRPQSHPTPRLTIRLTCPQSAATQWQTPRRATTKVSPKLRLLSSC